MDMRPGLVTHMLEKQLNGCYTRMLRAVFDVNLSEHIIIGTYQILSLE